MPAINFHYFQEGNDTGNEDLNAVVKALQLIRSINATVPSSIITQEVLPGPTYQTAADLARWVKNESWGHHASCSNKMGPVTDPMAVVNSDFRVFGTKNLRVVDASIFPQIPGYYVMIPIMMVSEKASDVILADASRQGRAPNRQRPASARSAGLVSSRDDARPRLPCRELWVRSSALMGRWSQSGRPYSPGSHEHLCRARSALL